MFPINQVFQVGDKRYRLLWHDHSLSFWVDIDSKIAWPESIAISEMEALLLEREIERIDEPFSEQIFRGVDENSTMAVKREKAWNIIKGSVDNVGLYYRKTRGAIVREITEQHGITNQSAVRYIRRYWQRGLCKNALLPDYSNSGGAGKRRDTSKNKLGRKRNVAEGIGCNITPDIERIFRQAIESRLLKQNQSTITDAHAIALNVLKATQKSKALSELPTMKQFQFFYHREYSPPEITQSQVSAIEFDKDIRPLTSTSTSETLGPGFRYQIDATIADIYLLSEYDRTRIVGRPVIYFVIDVFSRMVVGMYVGFEGPSWVSAMMAITNTVESKIEFCQKYEIEITNEDWSVEGLPNIVLADKGEFHGSKVEPFIEAFGSRLENAPARRGDAKGIVERSFRTVQSKFKPYSDGIVEPVISKKRGGNDYRLDATLTLYEFTQKIIYIVLWHNNHHVLSKYDRCENMPTNIPANPRQLWNWGIANLTGRLRTAPIDIVRVNLMPHTTATLSDLGIRLFGCFYTCSEALKLGWFHRQKSNRPKTITVAYDPRVADYIYLCPSDNLKEYWVCDLTDRSRRFRGMSFWDMWLISREERKTDAITKQKAILTRGALIEKIEEIDKLAKSKKPALKGISNASRTKDIRKNKQDEKAFERQKLGFRPIKPIQQEPAKVVSLKHNDSDDFSYPDMTDILFQDDDND